ncbi:MAG: folate hydrolase, partial [Candidatus Koribacter versatilis]|nr:folate hydrolase [Candidatus Koribacter versatilis]
SDSNGRGYLGMSGSHTLEKFINGVARDITDPETNLSVWKRSQLNRLRRASSADDRHEARMRPDLRIGALGSGSDFTPFLQHLGVASLNIGYGGEDDGGIYHSIYDDFYWFTHFADTEFVYGRALAQTGGTAVMRLASAELLPFDFSNFANTVGRYADELKRLHSGMQEQIRERNRQVEEGVFKATMDPKEPETLPATEAVPPYINFAPLENGMDALNRAAERYDKALGKARGALGSGSLRDVNAMLIESERKMTHADGLPGRAWFQHMIYAPGFYTGYGVKTIPGVREAIEQKQWKLADEQIARIGKILTDEAALIEKAAKGLAPEPAPR